MNAEHGREFTAGGNAVTRAQISGVDEGPQLIAKLDVERNVALRLELEWKHCLSPSANSSRYWPDSRANLSPLRRTIQAPFGVRPPASLRYTQAMGILRTLSRLSRALSASGRRRKQIGRAHV